MNYVNEFFLRAANGVKFQANDGAIVSPFQIYVNSQIVEWQDPATGSFQMSHVDNAKMILFPMEAIAKNIYVFGRTVCPLVEYAFQCHKKDFGELPVKHEIKGKDRDLVVTTFSKNLTERKFTYDLLADNDSIDAIEFFARFHIDCSKLIASNRAIDALNFFNPY